MKFIGKIAVRQGKVQTISELQLVILRYIFSNCTNGKKLLRQCRNNVNIVGKFNPTEG